MIIEVQSPFNCESNRKFICMNCFGNIYLANCQRNDTKFARYQLNLFSLQKCIKMQLSGLPKNKLKTKLCIPSVHWIYSNSAYIIYIWVDRIGILKCIYHNFLILLLCSKFFLQHQTTFSSTSSSITSISSSWPWSPVSEQI